jgi:hypothetical protein
MGLTLGRAREICGNGYPGPPLADSLQPGLLHPGLSAPTLLERSGEGYNVQGFQKVLRNGFGGRA